jgi:hypothetical protein
MCLPGADTRVRPYQRVLKSYEKQYESDDASPPSRWT